VILLLMLSCGDPGKGDGDPCAERPTDCSTTGTPTETPTETYECTPAETETPTPGLDADGDGWSVEQGDCDDADPNINPRAEDVPEDGIDQDCDGVDHCVVDSPYGDGVNVDRDADVEDWAFLCEEGAWDAVGGVSIANTRGLEDLAFLSCVCGFESERNGLWVYENERISSLDGLDNLRSAYYLVIRENPLLTDLSALARLESLGYVMVGDLPVTSLDAFSNVTSWWDPKLAGEIPSQLWFYRMPLTNLKGLEGMIEADNLSFYDLDLEDLNGLKNLEVVHGELTLGNVSGLRNLCGLDSLQSVNVLELWAANDVTEVGPLPSLRTAGFSLASLDSLVAFTPPATLETVRYLEFYGNPSLVSVSSAPFSEDPEAWGHLSLSENPLLTDLSGLAPITAVPGILRIYNNDSLTSLDGLFNIEWIGGDVEISRNTSLPQAEIEAFLDAVGLENIGGTVTVMANGD